MSDHVALRTLAKQAENVERVVLAMENQIRRFTEDGWPEAAFLWAETAIPDLRKIRASLMKQLGDVMKGDPLHTWVKETPGLGPSVFFVLGLMPPLTEFLTISAVWKYVGLHVNDGRAPKAEKGKHLGFSARRRAYALMRVGEPNIKNRKSAYRPIYDARKEYTAKTHPDMLEAGQGCDFCDAAYAKTKALRKDRQFERERKSVAMDCSNLGGIHWSPKHRHADALRVMTKAILRDAWRVAHGQEPKTSVGSGDHPLRDNHHAPAPASDA